MNRYSATGAFLLLLVCFLISDATTSCAFTEPTGDDYPDIYTGGKKYIEVRWLVVLLVISTSDETHSFTTTGRLTLL